MSKTKRKAEESSAKQDAGGQGHSKKKKKKKNKGPSLGANGCTPRSVGTHTAMNCSDVGDFGGSLDDLNAAGPNTVRVKLPPLVVKDVNFDMLTSCLAKLGVAAEYKLSRIGVKVMLRTKEAYDRVSEFLKESNVEFFTHDIPSEKPFKAVIRGLPNFDPKAVETEILNRYKLAPTAVYRITRRDENVRTYPDSLFLVHFAKGTVTLHALKAIRSLFSVIVRWEPYRGGNRDVTQCQRCLNFGHGTRNCNVKHRCNRCAMDHASANCPVQKDESVPAKCANCGGAHEGADRQCPKREEFKQIRKQASTANQPGRKKDRAPAFRSDDFPPLPTARPSNSRAQPVPPQETPGSSAGQRQSPPPGFWRPPPTQGGNPDLFSADELMEIFVNMTGALRKCRSKPEQIQVLGKFIIQYGV